jgi:4-amino-4-deoxy-L-arabinose transferase-like glycosyltransferase
LYSEDYANSKLAVETWALVYLLLLALGVRLIFVALYHFTSADAVGYDTLAQNIMSGHDFSLQTGPPFEPALNQAPVYPYFLAGLYGVFGFHAIAVFVTQALVGSLTCCLMYFTARLYLVAQTAFFVALVNAVYPFTSYFTAMKSTETVFTFLMCAALYLIVRAYRREDWRWMFAGGLMLGAAILCRPGSFFFPFFLGLLFLLSHRFRKPWGKLAAVLVIASMVVVMPWLIRNYRAGGTITPLPMGLARAFWQTTVPDSDPNTPQYPQDSDLKDPAPELAQNKTATEAQSAGAEPQMWRAGIANIRREPKAYLLRRLKEYPRLWVSTGDYLLKGRDQSFREAWAQRKYFLVTLKLVLLIMLGILPAALALSGIFGLRSWLVDLLPLWAFPLYLTLARLPFVIAPRNTLPAHPYMLLFAVCGAIYLWRLARRDRSDYQL